MFTSDIDELTGLNDYSETSPVNHKTPTYIKSSTEQTAFEPLSATWRKTCVMFPTITAVQIRNRLSHMMIHSQSNTLL